MNKETTKKTFSTAVAGVAATSMALAGAGAVVGAQAPDATAAESPVVASQAKGGAASQVVLVDRVEGVFSATQDEITPTDQIAKTFGKGSYSLCSDVLREQAGAVDPDEDVMDWKITVTGKVKQEYTTTMGEVAQKSKATRVMACTCAGNPADGLASVNAETTGVSIQSMLLQAGIESGANAVTFVSADGYESTVPLWSVFTQPALVAYQINGEPLHETIGSANQVWIGGASANYFARDVVEIRVDSLDKAPAAPADGSNLPNVNVRASA